MLQLILIGLLYIMGIWALLFFLYKISPFLDNLIMKNTHISKIVQSIILLICTLKLPFYWYVILKIPITYIFINFAFYDENRKMLVEEEKTSFWFYLWVCLAILYNPIYQIPLGKTVWIWSGFTYENLLDGSGLSEEANERILLIRDCDVFVDGLFEYDKKDLSLAWRGSRNHRPEGAYN